MADKKLNTESLDVRKSEILSDLFDLVSAALMSKARPAEQPVIVI